MGAKEGRGAGGGSGQGGGGGRKGAGHRAGKEAEEAERARAEVVIHGLCLRGELNRAIEAALGLYEKPIRALVYALVRAPDLADDAFATFREHLVKGLPKFEWRSSLRTWMFRVARNAAYRVLDSNNRSEESIDEMESLRAPGDRTGTDPWRKTENKNWLRSLVDMLPEEDRLLLNLRVYQRLEWLDVARVMLLEEEPGEEALRKKAATLRHRYIRVRDELMKLARQGPGPRDARQGPGSRGPDDPDRGPPPAQP
ncbi:MAG TPA: sigma-70 family RNA polymerase sigma factor [Longimicrobium sp.]|nr:sigma-70 family RNA polymerase sigma factor [Longimicrobium sp.]